MRFVPVRKTPSRSARFPRTDISVQRGPTLDRLGGYYQESISESDEEPVDATAALRAAQADVLVCYLPVGSEEAVRHYAQCVIDALRACKIAIDRGIGGPVLSASSYFMKSSPVQYDDTTAHDEVERFIAGE